MRVTCVTTNCDDPIQSFTDKHPITPRCQISYTIMNWKTTDPTSDSSLFYNT